MLSELIAWAESKGARIRHLACHAHGRAFVATADIGEGDTVISLPQYLLLHAGVGRDDNDYGEAFRLLQDELGPATDQRHLLCLVLILERARAAASSWAAYINILPRSYDDPYWWSDEEVQLVRGTRLGKAIEHYRPGLAQLTGWTQRLEELYRSQHGSPGALTTYQGGWALAPEAARWARSTVWSRAFTVHQLAGSSAVVALVPVLDMIDHSPDVEVVWHTGPDGSEDFQFATLTPVKQGTIIANNYGGKTNDELLLAYGFLIPNNPADYFQVSLARGRQGHQPPDASTSGGGGPDAAGRSGSGNEAPTAAAGSRHSGAGAGRGTGSAGVGAAEPAGGGGEEGEGEGPEDQQAAAEQLMRDTAMIQLGLDLNHRLTEREPAPRRLVLSAQLGLLPAPELCHLTARLLLREREQGQQQEQSSSGEEAGASRNAGTAGPSGQQGGGAGEQQPLLGRQPGQQQQAAAEQAALRVHGAGSGGGESHSSVAASLRASLPDSAMHIVPRRQREAAAAVAEPSSSGGAMDEAMAEELLAGMGHTKAAQPLRALARAAAQLPALAAVRQQVEGKLAGMASEQRARALLALPADAHVFDDSPSPAGLSAAATAPGLPHHSRLAIAYVAGQRHILAASLRELGMQAGSAVVGLSAHAHPVVPPPSSNPRAGTLAFDMLPHDAAAQQQQSPSTAAPAAAQSDPRAFCSVPAIFDICDVGEHMHCFMQWLRATLASAGGGAADSAAGTSGRVNDGGGGGGYACGLSEVMCRPRHEALVAAAAASRAAAAASASGSRGRRRPLASLTLRTLRNISTSNRPPPSRTNSGSGQQHFPSSGPGTPARPPGGAEEEAALLRQVPAATAAAAAPSPAPAAARQPHVPSLPAGIAASLGLDMKLAYDAVAWGAVTTARHEPGDLLLEIPYECAVVAPSRSELLEALMVAAHALLLDLVAHAAAAGQQQQQQHGGVSGGVSAADSAAAAAASAAQHAASGSKAPSELRPVEMLVLHLMHTVGAAPAARLPSSEHDRVTMLFEMLEDSPVHADCQGAFDAAKSDFRELSTSVAATAAAAAASGSPSSCRAMRKVLAWPGAFGLYCWALGVAERCAIQVPAAAAEEEGCSGGAGAGTAGGSPSLWAVLPVVSAVPEPLRAATMRFEAALAADNASGAGGGPPSQRRHLVRVRAACPLPLGLLLSPALLLPFANVDALLAAYGPEALAWRRLLSRQHPLPPPPAPVPPPELPTTSASPPSSTAPDPEEEYLASFRAAGPRVLYELYVSPAEEDPLCQEKLELLAAAGLGTVHFLTEGLETKSMVQSALKICLADEELLGRPLVHQLMQLNQALCMFRQQQPGAGAAAGIDQEMGDAGAQPVSMAAAGVERQGGAGEAGPTAPVEKAGLPEDMATALAAAADAPAAAVPRGFLQLMQQARQLVLEMLEGLPPDHPASAAAARQLRHIVHDAQKHAKRRLRQMDTHEEQKSGGGGFWNSGDGGGAAAAAASAQQQQQQTQQQQPEGLELLRQGVHLYLEEVITVLTAWALDLGLESKLDPMCKRSNAEPSTKRPKLRHNV